MTARRKDRTRARKLWSEYAEGDAPLGWFEALYQEANGDESIIPWGDMVPNPHLCEWHRRSGYNFEGKRCLKIGCGLGDDAEYLASAGGKVTAFDIAPTAIDWCRRRFRSSKVNYLVADLFKAAGGWHRAFDFVLEAYTLQVFPTDLRRQAMRCIADFVAPSGTLLVLCRGREETEPLSGPIPWPLTRAELECFGAYGLRELLFEDYMDAEDPPLRRFRVHYLRS
jgi:SAM-dependent methyltransferase